MKTPLYIIGVLYTIDYWMPRGCHHWFHQGFMTINNLFLYAFLGPHKLTLTYGWQWSNTYRRYTATWYSNSKIFMIQIYIYIHFYIHVRSRHQKHSPRILTFHVQTFLWKSIKRLVTNCTLSCLKLMKSITQGAQTEKMKLLLTVFELVIHD